MPPSYTPTLPNIKFGETFQKYQAEFLKQILVKDPVYNGLFIEKGPVHVKQMVCCRDVASFCLAKKIEKFIHFFHLQS